MARYWVENERKHLLNSIPLYRQKIEHKGLTEAKLITFELAKEIHQQFPVLQGRTENAIYERLPYLENLLAGVFEAHHYAVKDRVLFSKLPRRSKNREPNLCNTRHKYSGAMTEYLKNMKQP